MMMMIFTTASMMMMMLFLGASVMMRMMLILFPAPGFFVAQLPGIGWRNGRWLSHADIVFDRRDSAGFGDRGSIGSRHGLRVFLVIVRFAVVASVASAEASFRLRFRNFDASKRGFRVHRR